MKTLNRRVALILSFFVLNSIVVIAPVLANDSTVIGITPDSPGSKDHTNGAILIQKNPNFIQPKDFEIVSESEEISGDPSTGTKDALTSWKTACEDWKKDLKETNKENLISSHCGSKKLENQKDISMGTYVYKSMGTYKIKVRVRGQKP